MVLIKEFRIVLPFSLEEYERAQMYLVMKMQQENTTGNEGVEILENRSFDDEEYGQGQYTSKIYQFHSKVPSWLSAFAPANALVTQEEAWNAYPMCKTASGCLKFTVAYETVIKCPFFSKLSLTIETIHKADNGHSENVHGLSKEQLAAREVETIDIASSASDYWSSIVGRCNVDFSKFRSARTGRGPLLEGWKDNCSPVMTAYKLVTVNVPYWGFGRKLEKTLMAAERALFLESHRNCFAWIDEWIGLTLEVMHELEQQSDCSLNKKLGTPCSVDNNRTAAQEESPVDSERALA